MWTVCPEMSQLLQPYCMQCWQWSSRSVYTGGVFHWKKTVNKPQRHAGIIATSDGHIFVSDCKGTKIHNPKK